MIEFDAHSGMGPRTGEVDPELREVRLTLEALELALDAATLAVDPRRLARVEDEPALALGDKSMLGQTRTATQEPPP